MNIVMGPLWETDELNHFEARQVKIILKTIDESYVYIVHR